MRTIITLIALLFCSGAQARLNETVNECVRRYGEPLKVDKETMTLGFEKEGLLIMCVFLEGKCVEVSYKKTEGDFSDVEADTLRDVNGKNWKSVPAAIDQAIWSNDTSYAVKVIGEGIFIVMTREEKARRDAAKAAKEKENLKGF